MPMKSRSVRFIAATVAGAALLSGTTATASAWPIPLTSEDDNYLGAVRGAWPVDDDTLLMAGRGACHVLYTGGGTQAAIDQVIGQFGATPEQAAVVVSAGRGNFCTQAPS